MRGALGPCLSLHRPRHLRQVAQHMTRTKLCGLAIFLCPLGYLGRPGGLFIGIAVADRFRFRSTALRRNRPAIAPAHRLGARSICLPS